MNSLADCLKQKLKLLDKENKVTGESLEAQQKIEHDIFELYVRALKIDSDDIEANFNMGVIHLQDRLELNKALNYFLQAIRKDSNL